MVSHFAKLRILVALLAFRLMVGFVVAVWSPYSILSAHPGRPLAELVALTLTGALLIAGGSLIYVWSARDFALIGLSFGPPLLVARGTYGFLRHPMYFSLILILFGEGLLFKSWRLLGYACAFWLIVHTFVVLYEEPRMVKRWGRAYLQYSNEVPRWLPRIRGYSS